MAKKLLSSLVIAVACLHQAAAAPSPAFPGAEGFGAASSGGRGGRVYFVTNLGDDGPGSLRDAVSQSDRMVLFRVSGTITLVSKLKIAKSNITIAGQTAPGGGVCLRGKELAISGENVVVRFLRIRPGDERGEEHDALTIRDAHHVVVDHCSMSWSTDSVNDVVRDNSDVTVQWSFITEPLNLSVHHKGAHGYGTGWGSGTAGGSSYHHNLIAHCNSRSPRLGSEPGAHLDVRNNVIYDMGSGYAYGGEHASVNYLANYYKPGPNTKRPEELFRFSSADTRMYLRDNHVEGQPALTSENFRGLVADGEVDLDAIVVNVPFDSPRVTTVPATSAYSLVLKHGGAMLPKRDAVDERIVTEVESGTGRIIDSQAEVGGWPTLASVPPPIDSDNDGMPDEWERSKGLDPRDAADGPLTAADGYTNLENYLNQLAASAMPNFAGVAP